MNCVYEIIQIKDFLGMELKESLGLYLTKERAEKAKEDLQKYNPNEKYKVIYRNVNN